jgi:hypothetical protein
MQQGICKIIVGAQKGKISMLRGFEKSIHSGIKIVIPHGRCIVPHCGHAFHFKHTFVFVEVRRSLKDIA